MLFFARLTFEENRAQKTRFKAIVLQMDTDKVGTDLSLDRLGMGRGSHLTLFRGESCTKNTLLRQSITDGHRFDRVNR